MASLKAWLLEPWDTKGSDPFGDPYNSPPKHLFSPVPTRLEYLAAFFGMDTGGYGVHSGGGPYGLLGLTMDQAHYLMGMRAFVDGWLKGTDSADEAWLREAVRAEHERVRAITNAEREPP